jgi:hypothetical protein
LTSVLHHATNIFMPANHKRRLVDIESELHRQFEALQRACRKSKKVVPSIPFLVNYAVRSGMERTFNMFYPTED